MTIPRDSFLQRIMKYCAEAERSTHDVLAKLISWAIPIEECEIILAKLRAEKFLDDRRFANSYVKEKWSLDKWGKIKITNALRQKNIDDELIHDALNTINEAAYSETLHELLEKKLRDTHQGSAPEMASRVMMFALSRGFEEELIREWLEQHYPEAFDN
jgi:regulatory protein